MCTLERKRRLTKKNVTCLTMVQLTDTNSSVKWHQIRHYTPNSYTNCSFSDFSSSYLMFYRRLIRLTSPNLNNLIGIGAIILYFNIYVFVVPTTNQTATAVLCNVSPYSQSPQTSAFDDWFVMPLLQFDSWLTAIGYSLCYGTIIAKMCRVYYIFRNPSLKKKVSLIHVHILICVVSITFLSLICVVK